MVDYILYSIYYISIFNTLAHILKQFYEIFAFNSHNYFNEILTLVIDWSVNYFFEKKEARDLVNTMISFVCCVFYLNDKNWKGCTCIYCKYMYVLYSNIYVLCYKQWKKKECIHHYIFNYFVSSYDKVWMLCTINSGTPKVFIFQHKLPAVSL